MNMNANINDEAMYYEHVMILHVEHTVVCPLAPSPAAMPAARSRKKKALPVDFVPRRSARPRKVISTKGTCGAPASRIILGNTVGPAPSRMMARTSDIPVCIPPIQCSSIIFREDGGMENYVQVTIRGKIMIDETVSTTQMLAY